MKPEIKIIFDPQLDNWTVFLDGHQEAVAYSRPELTLILQFILAQVTDNALAA
jgi:hypothetical protein